MMTADQKSRKAHSATTRTVQMVLNENSQLINTMIDCQSRGKLQEAEKQETIFQQALHRNLLHLSQLASNGGHPEFLAKLQAPFDGIGSESDLGSNIPVNAKPEAAHMGRYMQQELQSPINEVKSAKKPDHSGSSQYGVDGNAPNVPLGYNPSLQQQQQQMMQGSPGMAPNSSVLQQQLQNSQAAMYHQSQNTTQYAQQQQQQQVYYQQQQQQQQQQYVQVVRPSSQLNEGSYYNVPGSGGPRLQYQYQQNAQYAYQNGPAQQQSLPAEAPVQFLQQQQPQRQGYLQPLINLPYEQQQRQVGGTEQIVMQINHPVNQPMVQGGYQSTSLYQGYSQQGQSHMMYANDQSV